MRVGDPALDGSHGPHVIVDNVAQPVLSDRDRRHLTGSLRLRDGDVLTAGDGRGSWVECVLAGEPRPTGVVHHVPPPDETLGVAFALIKGGRPELVVQKLTEIGVDEIIVFAAARSVVKWDPSTAIRKIDRLRRVAAEAVMQSRRAWLPTVNGVMSFGEVAALPGCAMTDMAGSPMQRVHRTLMVGPEGGWSDSEKQTEIPKVRIAVPVLRAETASIAAGTLLVAMREQLILPVD